jgi:hypothetical protein
LPGSTICMTGSRPSIAALASGRRRAHASFAARAKAGERVAKGFARILFPRQMRSGWRLARRTVVGVCPIGYPISSLLPRKYSTGLAGTTWRGDPFFDRSMAHQVGVTMMTRSVSRFDRLWTKTTAENRSRPGRMLCDSLFCSAGRPSWLWPFFRSTDVCASYDGQTESRRSDGPTVDR